MKKIGIEPLSGSRFRMKIRLCCWLLPGAALILAIASQKTHAADIELVGLVRTDGGEVAHLAKVEIYENFKALTLLPEAVDLQGRFKVVLNNFTGTHVTVKVSGRDYKPLKITLPVSGNEADVGQLVLERLPRLQISDATLSLSSTGADQSIDLYIAAFGSHAELVRRIELVGVRKSHTDCLGGAPSFIVDLTQQGKAHWTATIEDPKEEWQESILAEAKVVILPCEQIHAEFLIDVAFQVSPEPKQKMRLKLPRTVLTRDGKTTAKLDLERWSSINIALILDGGSVISQPLILPGLNKHHELHE